MGAKRSFVALAVGLVGLAIPASAGGATQIGQTFAPDVGGCPIGVTQIQTGSPGSAYAAPSPGIVTSWSFQAPASPTQVKLKIARAAGADDFAIVGQGALETPVQSVVNTYPVRIGVQAGDVIGLYVYDGSTCFETSPPPGYSFMYVSGDHPPGNTVTFFGSTLNRQLDVSAVLEPDCDEDGFGDETQDSDLLACDKTAPSATITAGPKDKTKKKRATFEFTSSEAGATFECSLDGAAFAPCTSPDTLKVKKGKHTFQVQAIDQAGNVGSPATDDWKVKKKK